MGKGKRTAKGKGKTGKGAIGLRAKLMAVRKITGKTKGKGKGKGKAGSKVKGAKKGAKGKGGKKGKGKGKKMSEEALDNQLEKYMGAEAVNSGLDTELDDYFK